MKESFEKRAPFSDAKKESFLELYTIFGEEEQKGFLLIDNTKGIYPLVLYHDEKNRDDAFQNALNNIENNLDPILKLLEKEKAWTPELEEKLDKLYNCH